MYLSKELECYIKNNSSNESEFLKKIQIQTYKKFKNPHMISGFIQGRLLSMISKIIKPNKILEIGTFTGYSTICLSEGLKNNGKIITIDKKKELLSFYNKNLFFFEKKIKFLNGNALDILNTINDKFDLIFLDADKKNYSLYFDNIKDKIKKGGIILADNVLWSGKVIDLQPNKTTKYIIDFNKKISNDTNFEVIILPIRDGISLIRKK